MNRKIAPITLVSLSIFLSACSGQKTSQEPVEPAPAQVAKAPAPAKVRPLTDEVIRSGDYYMRTCSGEHRLVFVIDKSGTGESEHFAMAKSALLGSLQSISPSTRVSVVAFDTNANVLVKNAKMDGKGKAAITNQLNKLTPSGKSDVLTAVSAATDLLAQGGKGCKTIVLLSDGRFPVKRDQFLPVVKRLRKEKIGVSGLVVGKKADRNRVGAFVRAGRGSLGSAQSSSTAESILLKLLEDTGTVKRTA